MKFSCECGQLTNRWAERECVDCGHFPYQQFIDKYERKLIYAEQEKKKFELQQHEKMCLNLRKSSGSAISSKVKPIKRQTNESEYIEDISRMMSDIGYFGDSELESKKKKQRKRAPRLSFVEILDSRKFHVGVAQRSSEILVMENWESYLEEYGTNTK